MTQLQISFCLDQDFQDNRTKRIENKTALNATILETLKSCNS